MDIVAALRDPQSGCPWDLRQTHASLAPYVLEEAHEAVDAIERHDLTELCDELGDLLLQVVLQARLAEEAGAFALGDVVEGVCAKMVRRHPHVFNVSVDRTVVQASDARAAPPEGTWEAIKAVERLSKGRGPAGLLDDIPVALPGLTRAVKLQTRASTVGFDWHDAGAVLAKIEEEASEVRQAVEEGERDAIADEIGDLLFTVANLARHAGIDPEQAARRANAKFARRFGHIEKALRDGGQHLETTSLEGMEALWDEAKAAGL